MTTQMAIPLVLAQPDQVTALSHLTAFVTEHPQDFLRPSLELQQAAVDAAKLLLDPLAARVASAQTTRRNDNRKKRKRGNDQDEQPILQIRQVYTQGFAVKQVWEQAKRILDAAQQEVERDIKFHQASLTDQPKAVNGVSVEGTSSGDEGEDEDEDHDEEGDDGDNEYLDAENDPVDGLMEDLEDEDEGEDDLESESVNNVESVEDIEEDSDLAASSDDEQPIRRDTFVKDPNGLNDGFFSIDEFNKQSQFLEQMDARGDDDNPSDEDEVDWDADPQTTIARSKPGNSKGGAQDDEDDSEDETGATFGNADLDGSDDDDDDDMLDDEDQDLDGAFAGLSNSNEIRYADFFEPPSKKPSKTKRMRALPKTQPPPKSKNDTDEVSEGDVERLQNDLERAMADVRRDLLDSDEELSAEDEDEEDSDSELGPKRPRKSDKNLSSHEKQRAVIAAEIRRLEAASVAKRDWQLSGEARAADRPVNSLIEEDLEFERAGKPIAPVTAETSEEIDALIKRRILAREFDEVIRRVPGSLNLASETRRGRIELDDTKPQASLGEIYEAEHQKNADPLSYVDKRSAATKKQHAEIDILWKQVREQLDLLSNMHFKPKRVDVEIKTVEDKPRIAMEDARPVGEIESGEGGMLAPQEVYRPGADTKRSKDEIMLQGGAAVSREEMSREEKLRRRRREKERTKKSQGNKDVSVLGKTKPAKPSRKKEKEADKANIIDDLKKGGVKVVGKDGELQSIGKQKKGRREVGEVIGSNLKL